MEPFQRWVGSVADRRCCHASMQPEQPLIAPTLMGRGGDTALGMEQRSPEQRPPSAASPRAAVQVVISGSQGRMSQNILRAPKGARHSCEVVSTDRNPTVNDVLRLKERRRGHERLIRVEINKNGHLSTVRWVKRNRSPPLRSLCRDQAFFVGVVGD